MFNEQSLFDRKMTVRFDKSPGMLFDFLQDFKVEKILKGCLDLIPSPSLSVKIQIMGTKVCLRCKCKTLLFSKVC